MHENEKLNYDVYYVAKQPIFDRDCKTYGYELLFRSGAEDNVARIENPDLATINVVTCGFVKSQESVQKSKRIFINFTEALILTGAPRALPPTVTVVEVLEDVEPSPEVMEEIVKLKQEGYLIAIDDFDDSGKDEDLLNIADIIKVDVLGKNEEQIEHLFNLIKSKKALILGEKVDNRRTFNYLMELGFDFFQGYFFARPKNLTGKTIQAALTAKIRILAALNEPDLEIEEIVNLVTSDLSITYRLLRLLNSAAFGFSMKIESIQHAVSLLGANRMRHWLRMVVLSDMNASSNPEELLLLSLSRGKVLEELALAGQIEKIKSETAFLFGLLSLLDIMLDLPFSVLFKELPLSEDFRAGYTDPESLYGGYLELLFAMENDDHHQITNICRLLEVEPAKLADAVNNSHSWTESIANEIA